MGPRCGSITSKTRLHYFTSTRMNMSQLELFVLTWGVYPRRILLYLSEKGLSASPFIKITPVTMSSAGLVAPGKPPGSVPILKLPDGTFIKQSVAILEYLEDICDKPDPEQPWQLDLANSVTNKLSMRGATSEDKARMREILSLADEATSQFGFACHKGTALFVPLERTSALTANLVLEYCKKNLKLLEDQFADDFRLERGGRVTIAHCVLYSLLQFAAELYDMDLLSAPELPVLRRFYETYQERDATRHGKMDYPEEISTLARQWLPVDLE